MDRFFLVEISNCLSKKWQPMSCFSSFSAALSHARKWNSEEKPNHVFRFRVKDVPFFG